ncbi:MAG: aldose epimerase [Acidimicrobiaceae bacterium]|nr:aldose epimerase [Acidimicrobiaceae bacterium]
MATLSGEQHVVTSGNQRAVVTEVGASLRSYDVGGVPVCWGFSEDELPTGGRGQVLAPWPNRIEDGTYVFDGVGGEAAIDEPKLSNAIHGLVRWMPFMVVERKEHALRMATRLLPQMAYPFELRLEIEYALGPDGLTVHTSATNVGHRRAPFGIGFHDYIDAAPAGVDALRVDVHARRRLLLDDRLLPVGEEDVAGTPYAAVSPSPGESPALGSLHLDDCFTALERDDAGRWHGHIVRGERAQDDIGLWADSSFGWLMVYSGDTLAPELRRRSFAIEAMTCPPNAFRSGEGVIALDPGATFAAAWGISPGGIEP